MVPAFPPFGQGRLVTAATRMSRPAPTVEPSPDAVDCHRVLVRVRQRNRTGRARNHRDEPAVADPCGDARLEFIRGDLATRCASQLTRDQLAEAAEPSLRRDDHDG